MWTSQPAEVPHRMLMKRKHSKVKCLMPRLLGRPWLTVTWAVTLAWPRCPSMWRATSTTMRWVQHHMN